MPEDIGRCVPDSLIPRPSTPPLETNHEVQNHADRCCRLLLSGAALADITVGIAVALTGLAFGPGIPTNNQIKLWPTSIAGEKLKVVVLDDATDLTNG